MKDGEALVEQLAGKDAAAAQQVLKTLVPLDASRAELDAALEPLRYCGTFPALRRLGRDVRDAVLDTRRLVARTRGRRFGLRAPLPADFAELPEQGVVWEAIALVWDAASIYDGPQQLTDDLALATGPQRGLYGAWWTRSEVGNGGFAQYFHNSTGVVAPWALEGFRQQEALTLEACLEEALARFPAGVDLGDTRARRAALDGPGAPSFEDLDDRFYAVVDAEFLPLAAAYVRAHREVFFDPAP